MRPKQPPPSSSSSTAKPRSSESPVTRCTVATTTKTTINRSTRQVSHPACSGAVTRTDNERQYGDVIASDAVHDDIRVLGKEVRTAIAQHLSRDGTEAAQVLAGVRQFGPSKESRQVLNKENEAARLAFDTGVYCVWRCTEKPRLSGANNDFCCRLGYRHVCFCGHPLAAHAVPGREHNNASGSSGALALSDAKLARWKASCTEAGCSCGQFAYVPNTPLEIGEAWLTRRVDWQPAKWSAKCRCGHGHKAHDAASYHRCRECSGCNNFTSAFLCVVCDLPWEAHETVWESERQRVAERRCVREAYAPLHGVSWDVRACVLADPSLGGRVEPSATDIAMGAAPRLTSRSLSDRAGSVEVEYCPVCAKIYRNADVRFCPQCGHPRPR